jgi:hypothetical protein
VSQTLLFKKLVGIASCVLMLTLIGCSSGPPIEPVPATERINHICIQKNPRVMVEDFTIVMQEGFMKRGITSTVIVGDAPKACVYMATYTALRSWDLKMYLAEARIDIYRMGQPIAAAPWRLTGRSRRYPYRLADTRTKIGPVMEALLVNVPRPDPEAQKALIAGSNASMPSDSLPSDLARKLSELKDAYDAQLISREEYEAKRKALIDQL